MKAAISLRCAVWCSFAVCAPVSADTPEENFVLEDIVVTAQYRSENAEHTPVSMDVVSGSIIQEANATMLPDISHLVPAIQIGQSAGANPVYYIRGVGSLATNSLTDAAVSLNYDGVPLMRQYQGNGVLFDLERVEVLNGPQGTLYGRNATAGVVSFVPQPPVLGKDSAVFETETGNYAALTDQGAVNVAVNDESALRASFQTVRHSGYLNDGEQDEDGQSARLQYLVLPSDDLTLKVGGDFYHEGGLGGGYALEDQANFTGYPAGTPLINVDDRVGYLSTRGQLYWADRGRSTITDPVRLGFNNTFWGINSKLDVDTDFGTLSVIPAYRHSALNYLAVNSFELNVDEQDQQSSLEARLASKESQRLRWIIGVIGMRDDVAHDHGNYDLYNGTGSRQNYSISTDSSGAFLDGTFDVTEGLRLIAGIRHTTDRKEADGLQTNLAGTGGFIPLKGEKTWEANNWRAGLQWDLTSTSMVYATVATGYHAGGFFFRNLVLPTDTNTYQPEKITAYTVGEKGRFLDDRVEINLEVFRWDLKDQQVSVSTFDSSGNRDFFTVNAGNTTSQGVSVDLQVAPGEETRVGLQVQYLDAKFDSLIYSQAIAVQPGFGCKTSGAAPTLVINCSGLRPPEAPEWTANLSLQQTFKLPAGRSVVAALRGHYQSQTLVAFNYLPDDYQKAAGTVDLDLTYHPKSEHWSGGIFVDNITNSVIKELGTHIANIEGYELRPPRTFGARASMKF